VGKKISADNAVKQPVELLINVKLFPLRESNLERNPPIEIAIIHWKPNPREPILVEWPCR
jgi:hypothetical protein